MQNGQTAPKPQALDPPKALHIMSEYAFYKNLHTFCKKKEKRLDILINTVYNKEDDWV